MKTISFVMYYIVTFYRLSLLIDISISDVCNCDVRLCEQESRMMKIWFIIKI